MGGTCESVDGSTIGPRGITREQCWQKGGVSWSSGLPGMAGYPQSNPNLPAAVATLTPKSPDAAKAVDDAKKAADTAAAATAAAGKAEATAVVAQQNAVVATAAATDAKAVRDKCIKAANDAHQTAIKACGPELGAKEGFGDWEGFGRGGGGCGMWLLFLLIVLVFVAICMQGKKESVLGQADVFTIDGALV